MLDHLLHLGADPVAISNHLPKHLTLSLLDGVLCLSDSTQANSLLKVDFLTGPLSYRSQQHLGAENLIKACRIKGREQVKILDATCGLGTDSFLLQQAGFAVRATEQHPVIHSLLLDGLHRYSSQQHTTFDLSCDDAVTIMDNESFDVIYLDPMFPTKTKSAKTKKTMQLFQALHRDSADNSLTLLQAALSTAGYRVVIKRPAKSSLLTEHKPTFQLSGKTCRFDVYQI